LAVKNMTLPVVVPGITAGLSFVADLFLGDGDVIIASDPCWDNYSLIFEERRQARMRGVKMFTKWDSLDVDVIVDAIREEAKTGFVRVIFNFPNNPSGYSPTRAEAHSLISAVSDIARSGARVLAICDDAYFGFFYEEETSKESLFGALAGLHENVLAVKIDGPTKEDYVWGLRLAFVSFGSKALPAGVADALQKKLMGAIRSSVSCANTPAQSIFLKSAGDPHSSMEKEAAFAILKRRYERVKACVRRDNRLLSPLPFNSGYFMSFRCNGLDAHALRLRLLEQYGIGVIALGAEYIRVAFSSLDEDIIPEVYEKIYMCAQDVAALAHSETPPTTSRLQHH
jgi:aspartate/methionine/tyrosine aminotransferase